MKFYLKSAINSLLHQFAAEIPSLTDVDINKELFETTAARRKGTLSQTRGEGGVSGTYKKRSKFLQRQRTMHFSVVSHSLFKVKVPETGLCILKLKQNFLIFHFDLLSSTLLVAEGGCS